MERNIRTTFEGVVTSIKMNKTITVTVSTKRNDSLYAKRVGYSKKFYAHDEKNECKIGDEVIIESCRPISKLKKFRLVEITKHAVDTETAKDVEKALETSEGSATEIEPAVSEEAAPVEAAPVKEAE
jgi:small subunit ribosomal protein S17